MNLTPREYEVVRLFALGLTWEQVMAEMDCSRTALHMLRSRAMQKADTGTMQGLWRAIGWLRVPNQTRTSDSTPRRESPVAAVTPASSLRRVG